MTWATYLLWGALLAYATVAVRSLLRSDERATARWFHAGTTLLTIALLILTSYFLLGILSVEYVHAYTRTDYPWYYRLTGLWAGQKGTLLLWAAATGLFGSAMIRMTQRAAPVASETSVALGRIRGVLALVLLALTGATLVAGTFDPTPGYYLRPEVKPDGNGLQPVLLTPFMIIHPPIQFLAYALTAILFAGAIAHVLTGDRAWTLVVRPWARLAWLLSTVGLGLGGLWAYYVLNFGGFWAWDPVETANLIAWFPLTLFLHALLPTRSGRPRATAALYAFLAFVLTLFSTLATRSGLWVSVHAFTDPSKNFARDPLERFLNILATGTLLQYLAALFALTLLTGFWSVLHARARGRAARIALASVFVAAAAFVLIDTVSAYSLVFQAAHAVTFGRNAALGLLLLAFLTIAVVVLTGPEEAPTAPERGTTWTRWAHPRRLLDVGIVLMALALLVVFLIDVAAVNGYDRRIFDQRVPYLSLPIFLVLAATFLRAEVGPRAALAAAGAAGALGLLLALVVPGHARTLVALPALLLVLGASLRRFWSLHAAPAPRRTTLAAALLLGAGLLVLVRWANPPTHVAFGAWSLRPDWWWALPAYVVGAFALLAAAWHRLAPSDPRSRWAAAAASVLLLPWLAPVGLAALVLMRGQGAHPARWSDLWRTRRALLRTSSVYVLHAGLALGMIGYAFATYESHESDAIDVDAEGSPAFRGYSFRLLEGRGVGHEPLQGLPREIHADVLVLRDGLPLEKATLVYWLVVDGTPGHYDARVTVVRRATGDLYLFPQELSTPHAVLFDHVNDARPTDPSVTAAKVTVKVLPGMTLVWSGLWILGLAMTANLALGGFALRQTVAEPATLATARNAGPRPAPAADDEA